MDIYEAFDDYHFDGRQNFSKITDNWVAIDGKIEQMRNTKLLDFVDKRTLGHAFHTVQDFYAHSNYVELYIEYHLKAHGVKPLDEQIPIFSEGIKIENFKTNYLEPRLRTGDFSLWDWILNKIGLKQLGPNDHLYINKDSESHNLHSAARNVATRETTNLIDQVYGD